MSEALHDLIKDFQFPGSDAWRTLAEKSLRGADFDEALLRRTADGIARGPVFFEDDAPVGTIKSSPATSLPWQIRQMFVEPTSRNANQAILGDLLGGVSQVSLLIDRTGKYGLEATNKSAWAAALEGVDLAIAPVFLEPGHDLDAADFAQFLTTSGATIGGLGLCPDHPDLGELAREHPGFTIASVDACCIHETGGTEAQELGYAAAGYAEAIGRLIETGDASAQTADAVEVSLAVDADIHLSIAKLRAGRLVLGAILRAFDIDASPSIRAMTSARMMMAADPWTNMVRTSAACFAAAAGGADAVTVLPATHALGRPDKLARRVARNTQIILQEEAHVGLVTDASAGSYLHETLTRKLAMTAWAEFQGIERQGGYGTLDENSKFMSSVEESRRALERSYVSRERILLGVNRFAAPDLREMEFEDGETPPSSDPRFPRMNLEQAAQAAGGS